MTQHIRARNLYQFLEALGRCYHQPGKLYLVGGTSLLLVAAKESTFDVDVQFEVDSAHRTEFIRCLRLLSRQFGFPIEQVSPDHFIPLPAGYQRRHQFIGRYGALDVFHFDFYSAALSKLHRGNEKDLADVISMVDEGIISEHDLDRLFDDVHSRLEYFSLEADPAAFARKYTLFKRRLAQTRTAE